MNRTRPRALPARGRAERNVPAARGWRRDGAWRAGAFTLVELMVALALAAMIAVAIMFISSTARDTYRSTIRKVEVYNRFRLALRTVRGDLSSWLPTPDLEFYVDGRGAGARSNRHWDPGEELPDQTDELGPGVVDGGVIGEFDEFASIVQRHYRSVEPNQLERADTSPRIHDAYQVYFRTLTYVDGQVREANVEYMLVDPNRPRPEWINGVPPPPEEVEPENVKNLALYKVVRYLDINPDLVTNINVMPIRRRVIEVATNVTDFRVEYLSANPYRRRSRGGGAGFRTPEEESRRPVEPITVPKEVEIRRRGSAAGAVGTKGYRKVFGYGTVRLGTGIPAATAFAGSWGDNNLRAPRHEPLRFGFRNDPNVQFAELVPGDRIYVFKETDRGGGQRPGVSIASLGGFPTGDYTIRANFQGELELVEDVDQSHWNGRDQRPLHYKAAYTPSAVRVTVRMVDDDGLSPKTMQEVIWIRRRSR